MKIIRSENNLLSSKKAAQQVVREVLMKKNAVVGFATGSSPIQLYKELINYYEQGMVSFKDVIAFNLDEYIGLEKEDENSYAYFMKENLFKHIDILEKNCHIEDGKAKDMAKECLDYEKKITDFGGIDIQILGIGTNGHIGFNEPSDKIPDITNVVELTQSTIDSNSKYFEKSKMPTQAVSMGIGTIMKARKILLIASGTSKAQIIQKMLNEDISMNVPATFLRMHPDVTIYVDEEAGSLI